MKHATRQRKQLAKVNEWLARARPGLEQRTLAQGWCPEFSLLIAMEQLVKYLEGEKDLEIAEKSKKKS